MNFSLFQALGEKHPSPQIYISDFPSDLRASLYLLLGGYYRGFIQTSNQNEVSSPTEFNLDTAVRRGGG